MAFRKLGVGLLGACIGSLGFIVLDSGGAPNVHRAEIFQREEGKPSVMRTYKFGRDGILVENLEERGRYIPMWEYLKTIPDKADREIEEIKIRKAAGFYK